MELRAKNNTEINKYELEVAVSPEDFDKAVNAVYKTESKKMNIPGFRKGKAPRAIIEKYYGDSVFYEAAVDKLYQPTVMEAIEKSELEVVSVSNFDIVEIDKEKGLECKITVVVKPEVNINDYKGIKATKAPAVVTDEEIDAEIEKVRERNSRMVDVDDRPAKDGDITVIDFDGYVDDVQFDGGKAENYELTLGAGQFIPGFEEQIVGHSIDEEFDVNVTFPEDYHAEELKGKEAVFKIKLHEIKVKELPEVDDEFVKDVSEFDTLEEYKNDTKEHLLSHKVQDSESAVENQIIEAVIEKVEAEVPEEMVQNEVDEIINSFAYRLQSQGLNLETYLKYTGMTTDDMRAQYHDQADKQVKLRLGLEKIAELENIVASEEEIEEEYKKLSEAYNMPDENVRNLVSSTALASDINNRNTMEFLKSNAVISEETVEEEKPAKKAPAKKKAAAKKADTEDKEAKPAPKKRATKKKSESKDEAEDAKSEK